MLFLCEYLKQTILKHQTKGSNSKVSTAQDFKATIKLHPYKFRIVTTTSNYEWFMAGFNNFNTTQIKKNPSSLPPMQTRFICLLLLKRRYLSRFFFQASSRRPPIAQRGVPMQFMRSGGKGLSKLDQTANSTYLGYLQTSATEGKKDERTWTIHLSCAGTSHTAINISASRPSSLMNLWNCLLLLLLLRCEFTLKKIRNLWWWCVAAGG